MSKALFLDRDGTINVEVNYLYKPEEFAFVPGIVGLCKAAQRAGYLIVVVTNQSGIARGYYTEEDYRKLTQHMTGLFAHEGVQIADVLHCPCLEASHPDRKPNPGLFLKAKEKWSIDMAASLSLGDKERDVTAGRNAGVGRNYLLSPAVPENTAATGVVPTPEALIPFL